MKLRFTVRRLLIAFCLIAIALAWMGSNYRRALVEIKYIESMHWELGDGAWIWFQDGPATSALSSSDHFWMAVWPPTYSVVLAMGGDDSGALVDPKSAARSNDYQSKFAEISRTLDESTTFRVTQLQISFAAVPKALREAQWVREVKHFVANACHLSGMPFNRMSSLETLYVNSCIVTGEDFENSQFLHLQEVVFQSCDWIEPRRVLRGVTTSPQLESVDLWNRPLDDEVHPSEAIWVDEDLELLGNVEGLHSLRIDGLKIERQGFTALLRCKKLADFTSGASEVHAPIDALLTHPTLESVAFELSDLRNVPIPKVDRLSVKIEGIGCKTSWTSAALKEWLSPLSAQAEGASSPDD